MEEKKEKNNERSKSKKGKNVDTHIVTRKQKENIQNISRHTHTSDNRASDRARRTERLMRERKEGSGEGRIRNSEKEEEEKQEELDFVQLPFPPFSFLYLNSTFYRHTGYHRCNNIFDEKRVQDLL